ncbi:hypothetical protein PORY_000182 [Pneumocystis oryctolagi]|uniref:Uncharacterized protein n=1 Tax=Pneumocystis oryctolagi TaxID=42067 RepID=A0ACB7CGM6_9ASCO|nr:hypothetical protein PORY_000182 [Pneumocystis oryctolagi]
MGTEVLNEQEGEKKVEEECVNVREGSPGLCKEVPAEPDGSALIVISKNWLLPSRPKPGRRLSKEAPLTKRKAQNRAAQRAFRERRAARVLELETSVKDLQNMVDGLKQEHFQKMQLVMLENERLKQENESLQREIMCLKGGFEKMKNYGNFNMKQMDSHVPNGDLLNTSCVKRTPVDIGNFPSMIIGQAVPLRRKMADLEKTENIRLRNLVSPEQNLRNIESMQHVGSSDFSNTLNYMKCQKKTKTNDQGQINTDMSFSAPFVPKSDGVFHGNDCGFCTGNPDICLCIQTQNMNNKTGEMVEIDKDSILPPILIENSDNNVGTKENTLTDMKKTTEKLEILEPSSYTIQNEYEPGSCPQCKADSLSMLFCKTLASKANNNGAFVNCILNDEKKNYYNNSNANNNLGNNHFLPCSTAYKALSQHRRFVKENFGIIINNLAPGTRGMQIQADKVQETLRLLDQ